MFAGIFRQDPMDNKSERSKSQMILRYGTYIFYILVVLLLVFIYFYVSNLQKEQNPAPVEKPAVEAPAESTL